MKSKAASLVGAGKHELIHQTLCTAAGNTNNARTTIGIGEQVDIYFNPPLFMTFPEEPLWYVLGEGSIDSDTGSGTTLTAHLSPGSATVKVVVRDETLSMTFGIVPPSSVTVTGFADQFTTHNPSGTDMYAETIFTNIINPTTVSFYNVTFRENPEPSSVDITWPNQTLMTLTFTRNTTGSKWFPCGQDELSDDIAPDSVYSSSLLAGATSDIFSYENSWTYQYLNDAGAWIDCCNISRKFEFRVSDHQARITFCGQHGGWQGPF